MIGIRSRMVPDWLETVYTGPVLAIIPPFHGKTRNDIEKTGKVQAFAQDEKAIGSQA